ncbi:MAG: P-II family nitrogen regulator [Pikeienuella sp.]
MQMHNAKRIEIIIEQIMERRLTDVLTAAGVTGFTVLPVRGGSGRSGPWARSGQISRAEGMSAVVCLVHPDKLNGVLEAFFPVLERHIGIVNVSDVQVVRAELF